ncbi:MAG: tRNA (adenosine(37)-N6)-threonylcarbamoyltransferase complex dimerization subunit type 1 TsaB [Bacteroidaceae bacterium]|nr:tRNA (adenosine(37)-N6)-threonylcarbamoyltransferase complex dimerization subunit type 1 TsaB [Bacteroidaceae bacterium]
MSCILNIETSTETCSVAVAQDGGIIFEKVNNEPNSHTKYLAKFVEEALSFAESHAIPLDAVAVSSGPGSYTGLRIGVSTAKGICYGKDVPLIAIPTLKLLCVKPLLSDEIEDENALLCPMIDARRMEAYTAIYDRALNEVRKVQADIIEENTYNEWLDKGLVYFFGNGAEKCKEIIKHPNARFIDGIIPTAKSMLPLAELAIAKGTYVDVAYFEPFYLKDFVAIKSKSPFQ